MSLRVDDSNDDGGGGLGFWSSVYGRWSYCKLGGWIGGEGFVDGGWGLNGVGICHFCRRLLRFGI